MNSLDSFHGKRFLPIGQWERGPVYNCASFHFVTDLLANVSSGFCCFSVRSPAAFTPLAFYDLFGISRGKERKTISKVDCLFVLGKSRNKSYLMIRNDLSLLNSVRSLSIYQIGRWLTTLFLFVEVRVVEIEVLRRQSRHCHIVGLQFSSLSFACFGRKFVLEFT